VKAGKAAASEWTVRDRVHDGSRTIRTAQGRLSSVETMRQARPEIRI
jgi:hypothetical protein